MPKKLLFANVANQLSRNCEHLNTDHGDISVLSLETRLLYTFLHFAKHYFIGNATIQMMMDFLLRYIKHLRECPVSAFDRQTDYLKLGRLRDAVLDFAVCYFHISPSALNIAAPTSPERADELFDYFFLGLNKQIANEYPAYIRQRIKSMGIKMPLAWMYVLLWRLGHGGMMPSIDEIGKTYQFVKRKKVLLPVAYCLYGYHRIRRKIMRKSPRTRYGLMWGDAVNPNHKNATAEKSAK